MPPNAPNQDIFVQALNAPPRDSDEYRLLQARAADIAVKRGLDLIFEEHKLDAAIFVTELGIPYVFAAAAGYALLRPRILLKDRS